MQFLNWDSSSPVNSKKRYLGIWYKFSPETVVWIANREAPLLNKFGVLNVTKEGSIILPDKKTTIIWSSSSITAENPVLQLLDSGNLVLKDGNDVVRNGSEIFYRGGSWNGERFTGTPELKQIESVNLFTYEFESNENEVYFKVETYTSMISTLVVNLSGFLRRIVTRQKKSWAEIYFAPRDEGDYYAVCGAYTTCNTSPPLCACLEGFVPKSPIDWKNSKWSGGCVRRTQFDCSNSVFTKYPGLKLPDTSNSSFKMTSLTECREECSRDCSCIAYANSDIRHGGGGCLHWFDDYLIDMRVYTDGGQDLYICMANPTSGHLVVSRKKKEVAIIVIPVILIGRINLLPEVEET
ncbi:hypothetical protein REPUB_Repub18cG0025500 [Reevesia pubescens]